MTGTSRWRLRLGRRFLGFVGILATILVIEPVVGPTPQAQAQAGAQQRVVIRGNRRIESETILSYMNLREGQTVTAEQLNAAVRRLFDTGLFRDVQIVPENNQLIVEVVENPSINKIAFEGNDELKDEDLEQLISLRPRLPFTISAAEADAQAIIEVYRRTGRYGASVEPVIIERSDNRVDLVFEISEGEETDVTRIDFVGNTVNSDRRLRRVIETKEAGFLSFLYSTDVYDPDRLELDKELLRAYYFERGYADFTVLSATAELSPDRSGFYITFTVSEGEQYSFGEIDADVSARGLDPDPLVAAIPDDLTGDTFDATLVEKIADKMTDLAGQQGFAFVRVQPRPRKNTADKIIDLTFTLTEGPRVFIERIEIEGNSRTLDRVIRRNIDIVEGDPYNSRKIREARDNIRGLNYFERVEIDQQEGSSDDRAVLRVRVKEKSTGSLSFGAGFSTSDGPIGSVTLTERNFLGRGQTVNARLNISGDRQIYDFEFIEPAFLDRDLQVGIRTYFVDDDQTDESSYELVRFGITPFVEFPLSEDARLRLRYEARNDDVTVSPVASLIIQRDAGDRTSSILGYSVVYDQRNDRIEPTEGYLLVLQQDFAGLGGDARYANTLGRAKGWTSFFGGDVIASFEVEGGAIIGFDDNIRINERYFMGGNNLRGFASQGAGPRDLTTDDSLGGNYRVISRAEVSFPLGLPEEFGVYGGFFVDAGTLWAIDGSLWNGTGFVDDSMNWRVSAGALLFVSTPFGPLEMSFGYPLVKEDYDDDEIFRLTVGTRF